jgi:hypothetical protein
MTAAGTSNGQKSHAFPHSVTAERAVPNSSRPSTQDNITKIKTIIPDFLSIDLNNATRKVFDCELYVHTVLPRTYCHLIDE